MYKNILDTQQQDLLDLISTFWKEYYLVWWTAIALFLWHRKSIDFDLFTSHSIRPQTIVNRIIQHGYQIDHTLVSNEDELTVLVHDVKLTFLTFPFDIEATYPIIPHVINSPDLLTLSSMKAYAMGRRSKWKDYVDMYFLMQKWFSLGDISEKAREIFGWAFEEKLFREQLCYYADIDYSEQVTYTQEAHPTNKVIQVYLTEKATEL